jgi:peroxiredoxin
MLSDWEGEVAHGYGVQYDVWKGHSGLAKRSVFVIDPEGTIVYRWVTDDALTLPNLEEAVSALQAVSPTSAGP